MFLLWQGGFWHKWVLVVIREDQRILSIGSAADVGCFTCREGCKP